MCNGDGEPGKATWLIAPCLPEFGSALIRDETNPKQILTLARLKPSRPSGRFARSGFRSFCSNVRKGDWCTSSWPWCSVSIADPSEKAKGVPRKLKVTKSLGICAPVESIARLVTMELQMLKSVENYVTALSKAYLAVPKMLFVRLHGKGLERRMENFSSNFAVTPSRCFRTSMKGN